ncbi:MAG: hypothetical protein IJW64_04120 [Clostridia bacterium]|nr:hypothetical protein [Clostridia bacterium]
MKKRIALIVGLVCLTIFSLIACNKVKEEEHEFVSHRANSATCETDGNELYYTCARCDKIFDADKKEIDSIPTVISTGHDLEIKIGTPSTCVTQGEIDHYECNKCKKLFNLVGEAIESIKAECNAYNHDKTVVYSIAKRPYKTNYFIGEQFDFEGMVIITKCEKCNGAVVDNQYLSVVYQNENKNEFSFGDTGVTLKYQGATFTVDGITVVKPEIEFYGLQDVYNTACQTPLALEGITTNVVGAQIKCEYLNKSHEPISLSNLNKGSYILRIYVEDSEVYYGSEVLKTLTVDHDYQRIENEKIVGRTCSCNESLFSISNGSVVFVKDGDMGIDLGSVVHGNVDFTISSIKKIEGNLKVDISGTNQGNVYTYSKDLYSSDGLNLLVNYRINDEDYTVTVISKLSRVTVSLSIGEMQNSGEENEYGMIYNVSQDDGLVDNSDKRPLTAFGKGELNSALPQDYDYLEFWLYNPTDTDYSVHLAGDGASGWMDSSSPDIALPAKTWTKVTISNADVQNNTYGAWYLYIFGGNSDGAQQSGWQISPIYAVKA